jgi:hypothetical protein
MFPPSYFSPVSMHVIIVTLGCGTGPPRTQTVKMELERRFGERTQTVKMGLERRFREKSFIHYSCRAEGRRLRVECHHIILCNPLKYARNI